jgi:hypothetical protein
VVPKTRTFRVQYWHETSSVLEFLSKGDAWSLI